MQKAVAESFERSLGHRKGDPFLRFYTHHLRAAQAVKIGGVGAQEGIA